MIMEKINTKEILDKIAWLKVVTGRVGSCVISKEVLYNISNLVEKLIDENSAMSNAMDIMAKEHEHLMSIKNSEIADLKEQLAMYQEDDVCNKLNCPMQHGKVPKDCNLKECPYRSCGKVSDKDIAIRFLDIIFGEDDDNG
jgi:hypothetical protein